jgi:2'-5' RNA ligase
VAASVRAVLPGDDDRPFRGHLTLARARERRGVDLSSVVGVPLAASFPVDEVTLVVSRLGRGPARYEVVDRLALPPGPRPG